MTLGKNKTTPNLVSAPIEPETAKRVDRAVGGSQLEPVGWLKAGIQSVRESLPHRALDEEKKRLASGGQLTLIAKK